MRRIVPLLLLTLAASACAHDRYGYGPPPGYGYDGRDYGYPEMDDLDVLDPWLADTREGGIIVERALGDDGWEVADVRELNIRFRRFADRNGDQSLTDREIREALVRCAGIGWHW